MTIKQRVASPTPKFFKKIRNVGLTLAAISATILTAPVAIPIGLVKVAGYLAVAGGVASAVSQTATEVPGGGSRGLEPRRKKEAVMEAGATRYGTMGGTLLVVITQINPNELIKTMVLAGVGAVVSYVVTIGLKWVIRRMREGKRP